jgi:hypothetical protein
VEVVRELAGAVVLQPVLRVETRAQRGDRVADGALVGGQGEVQKGVLSPGQP